METSNILKIDTLSDGWCDKDIVMLHACFQLLMDCIEKEDLLNGHTDWNYNDEFIFAKKEIIELQEWWIERKKRAIEETIRDLDESQYSEDNAMLIRLINIRRFLWT
jgi:hypothetical protein